MFAPDEQVSPRTSLQQQLDATFPTFRPAAHNSNEGAVRRTAAGSLEVGLCPRLSAAGSAKKKEKENFLSGTGFYRGNIGEGPFRTRTPSPPHVPHHQP